MHKSTPFIDYRVDCPTALGSDSSERLPGPLPDWIQREKQILRFSSYFTEAVMDQGVERERVRTCYILHYLEDETTQVVEPNQTNSGIPQG